MLNRGLDKLELLRIVDAVANEKSIDKENVIGSMESAIQKAALTKFGQNNNILVKIDRASMLNSLEVRSPFLDLNIIEFSYSQVPDYLKIQGSQKKILLKRIHDILGKNIKNKKIAFLGVTFKPNTDDMREATSLKMIPYLSKKGAIINYTDPTGIKNFFKKFKNVKFYKNISSACYKSDLVIPLEVLYRWNIYL